MTGLSESDGQFRPDLEGLRAVAVLLVLLYHARITGFGGGYVGVDVFFVLSGFFITGVIHRELRRTGRVDVAAFYARRARRLVPAAAVVLLATLALSVLILPSFTIRGIAADIASAAVYISNLRFGLSSRRVAPRATARSIRMPVAWTAGRRPASRRRSSIQPTGSATPAPARRSSIGTWSTATSRVTSRRRSRWRAPPGGPRPWDWTAREIDQPDGAGYDERRESRWDTRLSDRFERARSARTLAG